MDFRKSLCEMISPSVGQDVSAMLIPAKVDADYALPCFRLAKAENQNPMEYAKSLAQKIQVGGILKTVEAAGGYVNFTFDKLTFAKQVLAEIFSQKDDFGKGEEGKGKTVCIDFSSVNIAKPFHIGHLSSTVIGAALQRIYAFLGCRVVAINHLGDFGTQFGKLITAFRLWGDKETIEKGGVRELVKIYVKFHKEAEEDDTLNDRARAEFKKIEEGEEEATKLFNWFKEMTLAEVGKIYERLGIYFDSYAGESFYNDKMQPILDELTQKGLLVESDGAKVVELEGMPPCLLVRSDGATLYATRDLAAAFYRKKTYDFDCCLYVVAYQQNLHFKQWFKVVELMGYDWAKNLEHVAFGMVSYEGKSLSTREGNVVYLEDVLNKAAQKALATIDAKTPDLENKEYIAEKIGTGAVVFSALYNNRIKDIDFRYDNVLSFEGETGPYAQYTHARCVSILAKSGKQNSLCAQNADFSGIVNAEGNEIVLHLSRFHDAVLDACRKNEPCIVTRYVIELCGLFNKFYIAHKVLGENKQVSEARLLLVDAVRQTIANGLRLIGLEPLERM